MLNLDRLRAYLLAEGVPVTRDLVATKITGGRSNLTFKLADHHGAWVLRRPPIAGATPSAHDVGREFRVVEALQKTAVPVAPAVVSCTDETVIGAPFTIVGFVAGRVLRTRADLNELSTDHLRTTHANLLDVLCALHQVDYTDVGLGTFGRPGGFFERQARRWRQQWNYLAAGEHRDLERLFERLLVCIPPQAATTVVHGDYRIDNTLLDADASSVAAVIDWEMATLGDPLADLATMCAYGNAAFDQVVGEPAASTSSRWPDTRATVQHYAVTSRRDIDDFSSYLGLAYFKLAVIAEGITARYRAGAGAGDEPGFCSAGSAVPDFLNAGLAALDGQW